MPEETKEKSWDLGGCAQIAKALADDNRLRILCAVSEGRKPVTQIVLDVGLSQPLVSHHLKELRHSRLVRVERSGPFVYHEIADDEVLAAIGALRRLAARINEISRHKD